MPSLPDMSTAGLLPKSGRSGIACVRQRVCRLLRAGLFEDALHGLGSINESDIRAQAEWAAKNMGPAEDRAVWNDLRGIHPQFASREAQYSNRR